MTRKLTSEEIKEWEDALCHIGTRMEIGERRLGKENKKPRFSNLQSPISTKLHARIDLHGLSLEKAHKKFLEFVYYSIQDGLKNLLIITGKGNPGKIKTELPHWCEAHYLAPYISSCKIAEKKHGGEGAFYVVLKNIQL